MGVQDWERFGEEICRTVQDAVESQDFTRLNQTISNTINRAMSSVDRVINYGKYTGNGQGTWGPDGGPAGGSGPYPGPGAYRSADSGAGKSGPYPRTGAYQSAGFGAGKSGPHPGAGAYRSAGSGAGEGSFYRDAGANRQGYEGAYGEEAARHTQAYQANPRQLAIYDPGLAARAGGVIMTTVGFGVGAVLLMLLIVSFFGMWADGVEGTVFQVTAALLGVLTAGCAAMGAKGISIMGFIGRFRRYVKELNGREFCNVKELADSTGRTVRQVAKDLDKMIGKGWFRQGHLDRQKTCLMVTDQAYAQYQKLEEQMEQKRRDEEAARAEAEKRRQQGEAGRESLSPEVKKIVEQGDAYIAKIRACNEEIPGKEISEKISRMENLVDRIFDRVEQSPESVPDIHRLMEYYLPTTVKLLEAYEELDKQPVDGANIQNSKKEIEATLDTLNTAFEKLLDDLFQDTAWDLSSDISVLNAMLAQEGLTPDGLKK